MFDLGLADKMLKRLDFMTHKCLKKKALLNVVVSFGALPTCHD